MSKEERPAHTKPQGAPTCGHRNAGPRSALTVWSEGIEWRKSFFSTIPSSALCISLPLTFNYCKIQYYFFFFKKKCLCTVQHQVINFYPPDFRNIVCVLPAQSLCGLWSEAISTRQKEQLQPKILVLCALPPPLYPAKYPTFLQSQVEVPTRDITHHLLQILQTLFSPENIPWF